MMIIVVVLFLHGRQMRLLLILFFIYSCGKGFTQFGGDSGASEGGNNLIESQNTSDQLVEVRESTSIGNGKSTSIGNGNEAEIDIDDNGDIIDPVMQPVMVTAASLFGCAVQSYSIQCSMSPELVGSPLDVSGVEVYDQEGRVIPSSGVLFSHQDEILTIQVAPAYSIGKLTVNDQEVALTLTSSQGSEPATEPAAADDSSSKTPSEVPVESLLRDVPGGIENGHFDVDSFSCEGTGNSCHIEHVHQYDVDAGRNGIDLLNPREKTSDLGFAQTGIDFCILVKNAESSKEAIIKINNKVYMATDLNADWSAGCESFRLDEGSLNKLDSFELSFPVNVLDIPNGLMQGSPKVVKDSADREGTLIIRYVDASDGSFLKELSIYSHQ